MDEFVSESVTGQDKPKPSRKERDDASSSDAGRKAVVVRKEEQQSANRRGEHSAPVGLDLETKADAQLDS